MKPGLAKNSDSEKLRSSVPVTDPFMSRFEHHIRGHFLHFEHPLAPAFSAAVATRLLLIFIFLEVVVSPCANVLGVVDTEGIPAWLRVPMMMLIALACVRILARLPLAGIGLRKWSDWGPTERSYTPQVIVLGTAVFTIIFWERLQTVFGNEEMRSAALIALPVQLVWGFYQELMYRGVLQTALTQRLGARRGMLLANLVFTFGPLHYYHFASAGSPAGMFGAIFGIGLAFALIYQRSGNLWIVGILHGIGDWYIDGLSEIVG